MNQVYSQEILHNNISFNLLQTIADLQSSLESKDRELTKAYQELREKVTAVN